MRIQTRVEEGDEVVGYPLLSDGRYKLAVGELDDTGSDKNGLPNVRVNLAVVQGPEAGGMSHFVTIVTKDDIEAAQAASEASPEDADAKKKVKSLKFKFGMMLHFLHALGLYEGGAAELDIDTDQWGGKEFWADVITNEYDDKNGQPQKNNKMSRIFLNEEVDENGNDLGAPADPETPAEGAAAEGQGGDPAETEEEKAAREAAEAEAAAAAEAEAEAAKAEAAAKAKLKPAPAKPAPAKTPAKPLPAKAPAKPAPGKAPAKAAPVPAKRKF